MSRMLVMISEGGMCYYRLWTDEDNYNLIKDHYAWFLDTYEALPKPVMKADSARYLYMYHLGGIFALSSHANRLPYFEYSTPHFVLIPTSAMQAGRMATPAARLKEGWHA